MRWTSTPFLHQDSLLQKIPWWTCEGCSSVCDQLTERKCVFKLSVLHKLWHYIVTVSVCCCHNCIHRSGRGILHLVSNITLRYTSIFNYYMKDANTKFRPFYVWLFLLLSDFSVMKLILYAQFHCFIKFKWLTNIFLTSYLD